MKKKVLFAILILFLITSLSFALADENETEEAKIDKAYECLEDKVTDKCPTLLTEEKIFSLLAINECGDELISDSKDNKCWPKTPGCQIKTTAQAILALDEVDEDTDAAQEWLISQNTTPTDIIWYLQIENPEGATSCTISYDGASYNIMIGEDRKINTNAGRCLSLAYDNYWLRISPNCYETEFVTSCDKSFSTNLLFQKTTSETIHVSEVTNGASGGGTTTEKVESYCFATGNTCDYEGSLWATLVLDYLGYDVESYLPYLITMADDNPKFLPEAFLYRLTTSTDYKVDLLSKQMGKGYWEQSGDKYYDTALALLPFQYEEPDEKANAKEWLLEVQGKDGCWESHTRNTAFILYSIWERDFFVENGDEVDCGEAGHYCRSRLDCIDDEGQVLEDFSCAGTYVCCSVAAQLLTCAGQGGKICASTEDCVGGEFVDASDTAYCCYQGDCQEEGGDEADCGVENDGICRTTCESDEEESFLYTCDFGNRCCMLKTGEGRSYWWIWVLVILIVLVIIGIIFKDKLRRFWFRMKPKPRGPPAGPPGYGPRPPMRPALPRRPMPPPRQPMRAPAPRRAPSEVDEVLKKLKEMGK